MMYVLHNLYSILFYYQFSMYTLIFLLPNLSVLKTKFVTYSSFFYLGMLKLSYQVQTFRDYSFSSLVPIRKLATILITRKSICPIHLNIMIFGSF